MASRFGSFGESAVVGKRLDSDDAVVAGGATAATGLGVRRYSAFHPNKARTEVSHSNRVHLKNSRDLRDASTAWGNGKPKGQGGKFVPKAPVQARLTEAEMAHGASREGMKDAAEGFKRATKTAARLKRGGTALVGLGALAAGMGAIKTERSRRA